MKIIEIKNLSFSYTDKEEVLSNITLDIFQNDFLAIIGPNGGGKSTFLKLIMGVLKPNKGTITVFGKDSTKVRDEIGYLSQKPFINQDFPITVLEVVLSGLTNKKNIFFGYKKDEIAKAKTALEKVKMLDFANKKISNLSGGQMQRVFLSRALVSNPKILILDEPTSNIDPQGEHEIFKILKELNKKISIIVVSHDLSVLLDFANKAVYINKKATLHKQIDTAHLKISNFLKTKDSHLCEVELLEYLSKHKECKYE